MRQKKLLALIILMIFTLSINTAYADEQTASTNLTTYSSAYNKYSNHPYGYEMTLLNSLKLNEDIGTVKSRFESEGLVVEVLYDNFTNTLNSSSIYLNYGNRGILGNPDFKITGEYNHNFNGEWGHIVLYERKKLSNVENDRNFYANITFARSSKEVITVFMKSSQPLYIDYIMPDFKLTKKSGTMKEDKVFEPVEKNFDEQTKKFYDEYLLNNEKVDFGIFEPTFPLYSYRLAQIEQSLDYNFPVVLLYNSFSLPYKKDYMNKAKELGKVVEYTLYTTDIINGKEEDITLEILDGKYDDYLIHLAQSFNEYDFPVLFRLNNEMNGEWVLYSSHKVGKDTDLFIASWRYIYDLFKEQGVDNLIFVWNPNEKSFPDFSYNDYLCYYPGNEYVDVVGLTAYNTGNYYKGETWRSFSQAYDHFYYDYAKRFKHPMMITEFSCASAGGNKSLWHQDMFNIINKYDRIKIAVLWNGQDYDNSKPEKTVSRNYRIDLEQEVINAVRNGLQNYK
ncbi:MAG: glycosyl hydrolase [Sedimentibacter saalensis]|uniref:glycoside hydrolase family 26 protein n=1 Tax=Sedimentibacter saalensis TaxID=130788 RepID=UPI002B21BF7C|nr:glycosyl hydrolase [Sedimentibacter saalensis]MEA5093443.1 glycosyl hydrolase [Sedimentibacter saalensis]